MKELVEGKTVALVGPAGYMLNSELGREIDEKDVVVRINRGIESTENYPKDIGIRTDILYSCLIETAQQSGELNLEKWRDFYKIKYIVTPPHSDYHGISRSKQYHSMVNHRKVKKISNEIPIRIMEPKFHTEIAKNVKCKPNTGILAIFDLLQHNPKELYIYGYSFYLDGFLPGQKSGVELEKNCTENEFADMAFNSKRHIQKNIWSYCKEVLLKNEKVKLDKILEQILKLEKLDRKLFNENIYTNKE